MPAATGIRFESDVVLGSAFALDCQCGTAFELISASAPRYQMVFADGTLLPVELWDLGGGYYVRTTYCPNCHRYFLTRKRAENLRNVLRVAGLSQEVLYGFFVEDHTNG